MGGIFIHAIVMFAVKTPACHALDETPPSTAMPFDSLTSDLPASVYTLRGEFLHLQCRLLSHQYVCAIAPEEPS